MLMETLQSIYPDIRAGIDVELQDDGAGAYIKAWRYSQPQPTEEQLAAAAPAGEAAVAAAPFVAAVQRLLDTTAQQRRYDDIQSACTYATSTNATFRAEGEACVAWRDAVWAQCYSDLAAVQAGSKPQPASVEAYVATLPQLVWPS